MSWKDYGFTQNDLALLPMKPSLDAFLGALKERFELLGLSSDAAYQYIADYVAGNYIMLSNELAIPSSSGADYSTCFLCLVDYLLTFLIPASNTSLFNVSHSYFLTDENYNAQTSILGRNNLIKKAVDILVNEGFNSYRISLYQTINKNISVALQNASRQNKHWAIQRKKVFDLLRYALFYIGDYWDNVLGVYHQNTNDYTTFNDSLNYLTYERAYWITNGVEYGGHYAPIINLYYKDGQFYIYRLFDYFLVKKSFIESISFVKDKIYSVIQILPYYNEYSVTIPFWWNIDFNNIMSYTYDRQTEDYYVINCPFSRNDIIDIARNYTGYIDDGNSHEYRVVLRFGQYFYELIDGADYFQFLDA